MGRGLMILLAASIGLNIFAAGHFTGRLLTDRPSPPPVFDGGGRNGLHDPFRVMRYAEELSPELRDRFRAEIEEQLPVLREEHGRMRGLRRELGVLMTADEWDGEAIAAKLEEIRIAQDRQRDAFNQAFMSAFETLPAAERKLLIETANKRRSERRKKRRERRRDGPPPPPPSE
ncbi:periplasmic heavy metal sensor [Hyphococcus flavus]|uniref:Periplasmic heavy metal sensor n=1 Tax=Hyphococcus flavus TaxID=1866326 RepID=A0AAF0CGA2_9PROT|nr:periplasmic heavy metal sensor [Hyphococcus flavus]WDI32129.1 periplasmic heavy metal sensor [Hyphococcus flavus]